MQVLSLNVPDSVTTRKKTLIKKFAFDLKFLFLEKIHAFFYSKSSISLQVNTLWRAEGILLNLNFNVGRCLLPWVKVWFDVFKLPVSSFSMYTSLNFLISPWLLLIFFLILVELQCFISFRYTTWFNNCIHYAMPTQ